ncbi:hypothetical protein AHA02nite_25110 [Alkalibacillus haloalkaliphilus]|uniref:Uncharacterized protein n=1 Tax=Alkalibacillus haloalkaliphilus TaxID=94136 RepID=A0A511W6L2_9BACI|nr:hypothetical protein AHA02nite_25110 [Alkalibacillus haloalkaliphilus]
MENNNKVVLGCRSCKDLYEITNGFIEMPSYLMLLTAYDRDALDDLFKNNHSCPFVGRRFISLLCYIKCLLNLFINLIKLNSKS